MCGGDHGVIGFPHSIFVQDLVYGPLEVVNLDGLFYVTAKIFLVLNVMPSWTSAAWEGIFIFGTLEKEGHHVQNDLF